jgi:CheY-like chemotaxis protein
MYEKFHGVVLLVEDEPLLRLVIADALVDANFRVIEAASPAEAMSVLQAGIDVDVLLTDVEMPPGISGYELARQVQARWPIIEILITSGREWPREGDLPPGAVFLAKPCPNDTIVSHVSAAAAKARAAAAQANLQASAEPPDASILQFPKSAS